MSRIEKVNEMLKSTISSIIARDIEINDVLVTVTHIDTSPDLKNTKISVSIIPKNLTGTALAKLKQNTGLIAKEINKQTTLRRTPKISWVIDGTESYLASIEESFREIEEERN